MVMTELAHFFRRHENYYWFKCANMC